MSRRDETKAVALKIFNEAMDKAVGIARPAVLAHIRQSQRAHPGATPREVVRVLENRYTAAVATSGGAVGATAAAPGVGTGAALALGAGDATFFTTATAFYVFSLAEVYGIPIDELERRRTLLLGVILGDLGSQTVTKTAGKTAPHWAKNIVKQIPTSTLKQINKVLGRNFITKYGTKQGVLVLGKTIPFGLGAVIGSAGNAAVSRATIASARRAFGPAPTDWPPDLHPNQAHGSHAEDGKE
jgi:hypothetical protein